MNSSYTYSNPYHKRLAFGIVFLFLFAGLGCNRKNTPEQPVAQSVEKDFERVVVDKDPPSTPLSPEESMSKIVLPPGYRVELVASEPMVQEPVAMAWDANGRLYVAEMNTYMKDIEGTEQFQPTSRIKLLEDTDWDGKIDKSTIFIDSLVLPRAVLPVGDQLLVQETNLRHIWSYRDTDGDGKADEKKIVFKNDQIDLRNLEHQNGGLLWNHDNWIYPTRDNLRYKYKDGMLVADTIVDNMTGQWGITTDDYGRLYFSEAGPGLPAVQIEQMPAYGALNFKDQYTPDFAVPWPIIGTLDAQGGEKALRPEDNTLSHFTAGAGQSIFRGHRMPAHMKGDYFIPEPVGHIIKRGEIVNLDGKIQIQNVYQEKDWLASADMNFRPINTYTGPDGTFYIVDMYHGIIQESEWSGPGTYLGNIIKEKELYKNRGMGRIYRVVHEDFKRDPQRPQMLNEPSSKLVTYLAHPNGWWRDNAQQLLVLRNDKSVIPALKEIALGQQATLKEKPNDITRIHAMWTLEGMDAMEKDLLFQALNDADPDIRKTAVWMSEMYISKNDREVIEKLSAMQNDPSPDVRIQLMLSLRGNETGKAQETVKALLAANPQNEVMQASYKSFIDTREKRAAEQERIKNISPEDRVLITKGAVIYKQLCATCHGPDGKGRQLGGGQMPAPPLAGSPRLQGTDRIMPIEIMLHGLKGPIDGKEYPDIMPSMAGQSDEWIAAVLSYVRNSSDLGNNASVIKPEEVKQVRERIKLIPGGATMQYLEVHKGYRNTQRNWVEQ
ncbi:HEAT repeat domain-containing protein [Pontibacter toksunensis]|uniref:HEAT repeat domain-containing protein n=1 Tax=Pontibacter toksunensis TaxID=1332631 RepID=A0ABW6BRQ8_9BACT